MLHVYIVKANESAASIAAKFGGSENDLIRVNPQIQRKIVYYAGRPYNVFKDLYIGQQLVIPSSWLRKNIGLGAGESGSYAIDVSISSEGEACDFDRNTADPNIVTPGSLVCATGLVCRNGTCEQPGTPQRDTILCVFDEDCDSDSYCDDNTKQCVIGQRPISTDKLPPVTTSDDNTTVSGACTDDSVIRLVQSAVGINDDGKWGCKSQNALSKSGFAYKDVVNCTGDPPNPCDYGQCVNGKCPSVVSGATSKKTGDLTTTKDGDTGTQGQEESTFPWGWVLAGVALVAAGGGTGYYYYSKNKKSKSGGSSELATAEPARRGINNDDRNQWIDNDEGLYSWWKSSRLSKREFIKQNKAEIDAAIKNVTSGTKQSHYLKYEPMRKFGHLNEPVKRQGRQLYIEFHDRSGMHRLGSDGTIVILASEGITTFRGVMNRLKEIKRLNRIPSWAESYKILDYSKSSFTKMPEFLAGGSVDDI